MSLLRKVIFTAKDTKNLYITHVLCENLCVPCGKKMTFRRARLNNKKENEKFCK